MPTGTTVTEDTDTDAVIAEDVELDEDGPDGIDEIGDIEDIEDLDDEDALDVDGDDDDDADTLDVDDALDAVVAVVPEAPERKAVPSADAAADTETDDDELLADEVEASLDVILAERLRGEDSEADDDLDDDEDDAPNTLATVIPVRQPDEFLCQSCFLLKPPGQLADADHQLCRDCA